MAFDSVCIETLTIEQVTIGSFHGKHSEDALFVDLCPIDAVFISVVTQNPHSCLFGV